MPRGARRDRDGGFTLIELLVVVLVIGLLAAIAIPVYLQQRQRADIAAAKTDVHNLAVAYDDYEAAHPNYPYPDVFVDWGGTTTNPANLQFSTAPTTHMHAFDITSYFPTKGYQAGQAYCFEIYVARTGTSPAYWQAYYHSTQGGYLPPGITCQTSPNAS